MATDDAAPVPSGFRQLGSRAATDGMRRTGSAGRGPGFAGDEVLQMEQVVSSALGHSQQGGYQRYLCRAFFKTIDGLFTGVVVVRAHHAGQRPHVFGGRVLVV